MNNVQRTWRWHDRVACSKAIGGVAYNEDQGCKEPKMLAGIREIEVDSKKRVSVRHENKEVVYSIFDWTSTARLNSNRNGRWKSLTVTIEIIRLYNANFMNKRVIEEHKRPLDMLCAENVLVTKKKESNLEECESCRWEARNLCAE